MVTLVFGARGNVGRHVVVGLLASGERVRAVSRNPAAGFAPGLEFAVADLERPETQIVRSVTAPRRVLLRRKSASARARHAEILAAAQAQRDASLAALRNPRPASRSPSPTR